MKNIGATLLAAALIYGSHRIVEAIEYHAERTHPFPATYFPDPNRGCFPTRQEFEEYKKQIRKFDEQFPRKDAPPISYPLLEPTGKNCLRRFRK